MAVVERPRGKKEHGTFSVDTTPVMLQAQNLNMLSIWIQVDAGGKSIRVGSSALSTSNAPLVASSATMPGDLVLDNSQDAIWIVGSAPGTTGTWLREVKD